MLKNISVNWQSSIRIESEDGVVYIDPWKITEAKKDGDVVCITHDHYDHFSPEDIAKVSKPGTLVLAPWSLEDKLKEAYPGLEDDNFEFLEPGDEAEIERIHITSVPAYNVNKNFHKKEFGWLGYVIELAGCRYYVAGDTDLNEDIKKVSCDVALVPVGGYYTMDAKEAAELVKIIAPKYAVPTHYGCVEGAGRKEDGERFAALVRKDAEVVLKLE